MSAICYAFALFILIWVWSRRKNLSGKDWGLLVLILALYFTHYFFVRYEIEKIHLVSYSLLAILYQKTLTSYKTSNWTLLLAGLGCALVGTVDEVLQYFIPRRFFQWSDIYLNAVSGVLGLALLFILSDKTKKVS
ncbi:MAG: VanZ family protein [Candidatus Omnitrophica bacterium]|nr:VanZ family protein [Candidatus Omnitrophota bacterium]